MYSELLGNFLVNLKTLRCYVDNVDLNIERSIEDYRNNNITEDAFMAVLLRGCVVAKQRGIDNFWGELGERLSETIPKESKEQLLDIIKKIEQVVDVSKLKNSNAFSYCAMYKELKDEYQKLESLEGQQEILYNGSLMLLITYYENLVAQLFKTDFVKHPERINLDSKGVPYKILAELNDIEMIKEHLVEEEVVSMMYKSYDDWMLYFCNKLKLNIPYDRKKRNDIKEIIARRNLLVHNNGIVNSIYLNITGRKDVIKGDYIKVSKEYLNNAIDIIETAGMALLIEMWLKEHGKNEDEIRKIDAILYGECLENGKWEMGSQLYEICSNYKHLSDADAIMFKINMWQCYKWMNKYESVKADVDALDISATMPRYKLAVLALMDNEIEFWEQFDKQNDIDECELMEWPVFSGIREGKIFKAHYPENHQEIEEKRLKEGD